MTTQTRDPISLDGATGTWDSTNVATINDFPDQTTYLTHGTTAGYGTWNTNAPTIPAGSTSITVRVHHYRYKSGGGANSAGRIKVGSGYYNGTPTALHQAEIQLHT